MEIDPLKLPQYIGGRRKFQPVILYLAVPSPTGLNLYPYIRLGLRYGSESCYLMAGVTGKGGIWREKPLDAESAVGAASSKVRAKPALVRCTRC